MVNAMTVARADQPMKFTPDAAYTHQGINMDAAQRRSKLHNGANGDLWQRLNQYAVAKHIQCSSTRTPLHRSPNDVVENAAIPLIHFLGNLVADSVAGVASQRALEGQPWRAKTVETLEGHAKAVALRLAAIEA